MGCAKDIVEYVGVPRLLFSDFPLGNPAGRPKDPASQPATLDFALDLLASAPAARTTVQSPLRWSNKPRLEARLPEHRASVAGGDRTAPRRVRQAEGGGSKVREDLGLQRDKAEGQRRMTKPFAGVRILDFTQVFAGPFGSYQLALLGADVIKIERQGGDDMRRGPPNKDWADRNLSTAWMAINSNKRNITLDLTKPKAIEVVQRLAAKADVVMENFRPGVMDKLGIGYEALSAINPRLIYCAVSGFGQNGPERATAAYDGKIQAMSGIMSITGPPRPADARRLCRVRRHRRHDGGFAVSSALYQRTHTGRGQLVDVAMLDAALSFLSSS